MIPQMEPWYDSHEADAVYEYMKSGGWVTEFRKTREFEKAIADYVGARFCSVVSNGTVSLTLALMACDIGPGDRVIVPDYTMVATANAVKLAGAEVEFVDVSPDDFCLDYQGMCEAAGARTRAVILVSINGRCPAGIQRFADFCGERGIVLVEDAAQSLGSRKGGKHLGTFGGVGSFSFSAPKVISTGQGGALVTNDEEIIRKVHYLRDFGRAEPGQDHYLTMGWNFKFTDIQAVIGLEQMKKLGWRVERKKQIYRLYEAYLQGLEEISFIPTNLDDTSPWFIDVLVRSDLREPLMVYLKEKGVGTRPFYPALHKEPVFARGGSFPVAERVAGEGLWLPSSSKLSDDQVEYICSQIKSFFRG